MKSIKEGLEKISTEISAICKSCGRESSSVKLIAVSKTKPVDLIQEAFDAGQIDFGENKVQEMCDKEPELPGIRWHLIGHLQKNKVKYIAPFVHLIHSVDSLELLEEIQKQALKNEREIQCLLQINISNEDQKSGMTEEEAEIILKRMDEFPNVVVVGLMGMAENTENRNKIREQFRRLKIAMMRLTHFEKENIRMRELSMGMSSDYDIAIEEGATMIRVGSLIFGSR